MITGAYGPHHSKYPCRWVVDEADKHNFETSNVTTRLVSYSHRQRPYKTGTGIRRVVLTPSHPDHADIQIQITLNTDILPKGIFRTRDELDTGFAYVIDPVQYAFRPTPQAIKKIKPLKIKGRGNNTIVVTFKRDSEHDFELTLRPNGANELFNFRSAVVKDLAAERLKGLVATNSDLVPPLKIFSLEKDVDLIPENMPQIGYTGGNHTSDGGTGGTPTARMISIEHFRDGIAIDASKVFEVHATEYKIQWINQLMAWNTKVCGRYVADQIMIAIIRKGSIEFWQEIIARENITVRGDNGI